MIRITIEMMIRKGREGSAPDVICNQTLPQHLHIFYPSSWWWYWCWWSSNCCFFPSNLWCLSVINENVCNCGCDDCSRSWMLMISANFYSFSKAIPFLRNALQIYNFLKSNLDAILQKQIFWITSYLPKHFRFALDQGKYLWQIIETNICQRFSES